MAWIKFEKDLLTDPRVLRIARILWKGFCLQETEPETRVQTCNAHALPAVTLVCGALVRIWSMADTHVDENDILPLGFDELNRVVGIPGFCELLPSEWIEKIDDDSVKLPNYHQHNGTEAKRKAVTQKRVAAFRSRNSTALPKRNGRALPDQDLDQDLDQKNKSIVGLAPNALRLEAGVVLSFLNEKTGRNYQAVPANIEKILARLKEGATVDDCKAVIAKKCREWATDEKMAIYLRPATLFNREKFAQYSGELVTS